MARKAYSDFEKKVMEEAAVNLKGLLRSRGMSQTALAEKTGLPTSTISDYVNAKTLVSFGNLNLIADALKVQTTDIANLNREATAVPRCIPMIGTICAGDGMLAESNVEDYIHYPFMNAKQPDYALRVKGDSMIGAGIDDGDIVFLKHADWAEHNGQIVAVLINNQEDGTLKRIRWSDESSAIKLSPENEDYNTIEVVPNQIKVCGVYMGHFKPLKGE
ncbi:LexA family protein [Cohnella sp. 56]|uniref:LexA family protein n=1 Tax=Cohnella sp. 56 TaxID=3113722 RepID=UPI0030EA71E4